MTPPVSRAEFLERLRAEAARWAGTPFRWKSAVPGPHGGCDCASLAHALYRAAGLIGPQEWSYPADPSWMARRDSSPLTDQLDALNARLDIFEKLPAGESRAGDLLVFETGRALMHSAVQLDEFSMIHTFRGQGTRTAPVANPKWRRALRIIYRPKLLDE